MPTHHQLGPTATIKKQRAGEEEKDEEEVEEDGTMGKKESDGDQGRDSPFSS